VEFCHDIGLDYVSCSPYRLPIARLAAAQAVLKQRKGDSPMAKKATPKKKAAPKRKVAKKKAPSAKKVGTPGVPRRGSKLGTPGVPR
jgi:pyruvate,orthophosphate dikinase